MAIESSYRTSDSGEQTSLTASVEYAVRSNIGIGQNEGWLMSTGSVDSFVQEPGIADDVTSGRAWRGRNDIPTGYVASTETTGSTAIIVTVASDATRGFKANVPVLIAKTHDTLNGRVTPTTTQYEWRMVTAVTTTGTAVTLTVSSTTNTYYKGSVVVQPSIGAMRFTSESNGDGRFALPGVNYQLGRPDKPTVTALSTTSSGFTVSIVKGTNKYFAKYADLFVFTTVADALEGPSPNRPPDVSNTDLTNTTTATSAVCKTYGGGAANGGGAMTSTSYYWVVAVLKEQNNVHAKYISLPSEPLRVTTL